LDASVGFNGQPACSSSTHIGPEAECNPAASNIAFPALAGAVDAKRQGLNEGTTTASLRRPPSLPRGVACLFEVWSNYPFGVDFFFLDFIFPFILCEWVWWRSSFGWS
jgi:hypothetical protein